MVGGRGFTQGRWDLPCHRSHVAQLFSLGGIAPLLQFRHREQRREFKTKARPLANIQLRSPILGGLRSLGRSRS